MSSLRLRFSIQIVFIKGCMADSDLFIPRKSRQIKISRHHFVANKFAGFRLNLFTSCSRQPNHRPPHHLRMAGQRMAPTQQLQRPLPRLGQQSPQLPLLRKPRLLQPPVLANHLLGSLGCISCSRAGGWIPRGSAGGFAPSGSTARRLALATAPLRGICAGQVGSAAEGGVDVYLGFVGDDERNSHNI